MHRRYKDCGRYELTVNGGIHLGIEDVWEAWKDLSEVKDVDDLDTLEHDGQVQRDRAINKKNVEYRQTCASGLRKVKKCAG